MKCTTNCYVETTFIVIDVIHDMSRADVDNVQLTNVSGIKKMKNAARGAFS